MIEPIERDWIIRDTRVSKSIPVESNPGDYAHLDTTVLAP
jgi:hypothetical protein